MLPSRRRCAIYCALALIIPVRGALATLVPALSLEQLTDKSEAVVSGTVGRSWSDWDSDHKYIWTHTEIAVTKIHKGAPGKTVVVSEPGGTVGDRGMSIAGAVSYAPGEQVVVFLQRMPNGYLRTTGWNQGKFVVDTAGRVHGSGGGMEIVQPDAQGKASDSTALRAMEGVAAAELQARVERRVRARQGVR